jgi:hypothetical protein
MPDMSNLPNLTKQDLEDFLKENPLFKLKYKNTAGLEKFLIEYIKNSPPYVEIFEDSPLANILRKIALPPDKYNAFISHKFTMQDLEDYLGSLPESQSYKSRTDIQRIIYMKENNMGTLAEFEKLINSNNLAVNLYKRICKPVTIFTPENAPGRPNPSGYPVVLQGMFTHKLL